MIQVFCIIKSHVSSISPSQDFTPKTYNFFSFTLKLYIQSQDYSMNKYIKIQLIKPKRKIIMNMTEQAKAPDAAAIYSNTASVSWAASIAHKAKNKIKRKDKVSEKASPI